MVRPHSRAPNVLFRRMNKISLTHTASLLTLERGGTQMATSAQRYGALELVRTNIDDVLDAGYERDNRFRNFLEGLQIGGIVADDFDRIITGAYFPAGSAFEGHQVLASTAELYATLSAFEEEQLREHYFAKLNSIKAEFPSVCIEFEEQLR